MKKISKDEVKNRNLRAISDIADIVRDRINDLKSRGWDYKDNYSIDIDSFIYRVGPSEFYVVNEEDGNFYQYESQDYDKLIEEFVELVNINEVTLPEDESYFWDSDIYDSLIIEFLGENYIDHGSLTSMKIKEPEAWDKEIMENNIPSSGRANKVIYEIIRGLNYILYRYFNDGDLGDMNNMNQFVTQLNICKVLNKHIYEPETRELYNKFTFEITGGHYDGSKDQNPEFMNFLFDTPIKPFITLYEVLGKFLKTHPDYLMIDNKDDYRGDIIE